MPKRYPRCRLISLGIIVFAAIVCVLSAWRVAADVAVLPTVSTGTPVTFAGVGFVANESLLVWQTGPDGSVLPLPNTQADPNGAFSIALSFPATGQWQVTAHSILSGKETIAQYVVGATSTTAASPSSTTATPVPASGTSSAALVAAPPGSGPVAGASVAASSAMPGGLWGAPLSPASARPGVPNPIPAPIGVTLPFSAAGFLANEAVNVWGMSPDGKTIPLAGGMADASGTVGTTIAFPTAGQWQLTAHGVTSGKDVVGRYAVTGTTGTTGGTPGMLLPQPTSAANTGSSSSFPGDAVTAPSPATVRVKELTAR